ncbi:MAG: DNA primase regulatory subunit PriL [Halobacteriales archaeon]|nr:DNA primase regulatory subunit PriL [Halobacteriales archaeon]
MDALHARYPFRSAAKEAVEAADADLATVVSRDSDPVVDRALDRIRSAIETGTVGDPRSSTRVELLSYPVARVLVSLVDDPTLTDRYARAEAQTALDRFVEDTTDDDGLRSVSRERLTLQALLAELDLADHIRLQEDTVWVDVATYLSLASDLEDRSWRLVERTLADGRVRITREEFRALLRAAIRDRIATGLPLSVPDEIAEALEPEVETLRDLLADREFSGGIDAVVPALFPPCMQALIDRAEAGEDLPAHSRFSLTAFLANIGMTTAEIVDFLGRMPAMSEPTIRYQAAHVRDDAAPAYTPSPCQAMVAYGDCVNKDELCETIDHPLEYYEERIDRAELASFIDWREREDGPDGTDADA